MSVDPLGWQTMPLPEVLDFREGPGIMARDFVEDGVPLLRLAGLKRGASLLEGCNYLDPMTVERRWGHFRVRLGDVLLSTSASLGEVAVVDKSAAGAIPYTGIIGFRPRDSRVLLEFVEYALRAPSFKGQIEAMGIGSIMRHFGPTHLRQMTIDVPPLGEQRAIAVVLRTLQRAKEQTQQVIGAVHQLKRSLTDYLFQYGPVRRDDARNVNVLQSEVGPIPDHWRTASMIDIQASGKWAIGAGPFGSKLGTKDYRDNGIPVIRGANLPDNARFSFDSLVFISEEKAAELASSIAYPGDVVVTQRGTLGQIGLVPEDSPYERFVVSQSQMKVTVNKECARPGYVYYALKAPSALSRFLEGAVRTGVPHINLGIFREFQIPLPPLREQVHIEHVLSSVDVKLAAEERVSHALNQLFKTLLNELMTGKRRLEDVPEVA